ncbi:hypothetical protein [Microbacterium sp. SLBN-146]|uniref:hypothetical protein n=1 Tax=Microbacterium sp. SLBN-146 TaxID=2768457 RepID=UPI001151EDF4|nr:hypothetical protein [Microbacterium sp. SLBN-146]TQJ31944.1 hypothetical protein FBY39_2433 [Microbacterium sp. SLBN-146]
MTTSTHIYSAFLIGTPDVPLSVTGGSVTLDAGAAPHVQAEIRIAVPDAPTLALLDPRESARVRIEVDGVYPAFSLHREFDLSLRDRDSDQAGAVLTLALASDEALLEDYAPLEDDATPLDHQASLRDLVAYVLSKVSGALAPGSIDPPVPALAASDNLIRNPRVATGSTDWALTWTSGGLSFNRYASGGPSYAPSYMQIYASGAASTGVYAYLDQQSISVTQGRLYVLSVTANPPTGQSASLDAILYDQSGNIVAFATPAPIIGNGSYQRVHTTFYATGNASRVRPRLNIASMPYGQYFNVTAFRLSEFTGDIAADRLYFDGSFMDTAQYDYAWTQASHASVSTRKPLVDAATPDGLTWKAGQSAIEFIQPIVQAAGLRLVCDEQRVWTLRDENHSASGSLSIRYGVNMIDGTDTISRDSGLWFDARVTNYTWTDSSGTTQTRTDAFALTLPYTRLTTLDLRTAYPGPGRSEYAVRRAQGRGREVSATAVADWSAHAEQPIAVTLNGAPTQIGLTQSLTFDLDTDRMTVTTRTTDTPAGAIDLLPGTIDALSGTIDSL